jgi:hypothetical protein
VAKKKTEVRYSDDQPPEQWERQVREPDKAWEAFQIYRDMGLGNRSQRKVHDQIYPERTHNVRQASEIANWSVRWRWMERIEAWERHLDKERTDEMVRAVEQDARQAIQAYRLARSKGTLAINEIDPKDIRAIDAIKMVDMAVLGLRREAGLEEKTIRVAKGEREAAFVAWLLEGDDE